MSRAGREQSAAAEASTIDAADDGPGRDWHTLMRASGALLDTECLLLSLQTRFSSRQPRLFFYGQAAIHTIAASFHLMAALRFFAFTYTMPLPREILRLILSAITGPSARWPAFIKRDADGHYFRCLHDTHIF